MFSGVQEKSKPFKKGQIYCHRLFRLATHNQGMNEWTFKLDSSENDFEFIMGLVTHFKFDEESKEFFHARNVVPGKMALKLINRILPLIENHQYSPDKLLSIPKFIEFGEFLVRRAQDFIDNGVILTSLGVRRQSHGGGIVLDKNDEWQIKATKFASFIKQLKSGNYHPERSLKRKAKQLEEKTPQANNADDGVFKRPFKKERTHAPVKPDHNEIPSPVAGINRFGTFPIVKTKEQIRMECEKELVGLIVNEYQMAFRK